MNALVFHPLQASLLPKNLIHADKGMSGFFDDLFDFGWNAITGLAESLSGVVTSIVNITKGIVETIILVVRAAVGDVEWSEVFDSLGEIFQEIGKVMYYVNPIVFTNKVLRESNLTAHAFNELDKFTGGMITSGENVSSLVARAMRGDAISKVELLRDALFIIQVAAVVFGGPVALGAMVGTMVGRQVCSKQTQHQEACMASFQIVGAAAGGYAASNAGVNWGTEYWNSTSTEVRTADPSTFIASDTAYDAAVRAAEQSVSLEFAPHLSLALNEYLERKGLDVVTREVIAMCQQSNFIGDRECELVSEVAANYIDHGSDMEWYEFLGSEIARIGAQEMMLQWFPPESPEHQAIQWQIVQVPGGPGQTIYKNKISPKALMLLAAGATAFLVGGAV